MAEFEGLNKPFRPNWKELVDVIMCQGTPKRTFNMELFQDPEIANAIAKRFDLEAGLKCDDPDFDRKKYIALQRFCGFDYVRVRLVDLDMPIKSQTVADSTELPRAGGRTFVDEHTGPITHWEEFEKYPWPDPEKPSATRDLEWYQENLPEDMCVVAAFGHFAELLAQLMGYEKLCFALYEQRDLVKAIADKIVAFFETCLRRFLEFDRVKIVWASDDMGFKTGLLISPRDLREFVLPGHRAMAQMSHKAGRPYLLHCCGKLCEIIDDLIYDVRIDGKHSFEDTIEDVREVKHTYGKNIALIGGIDVDFLCRASKEAIRKRVRNTLDICMEGGRYCLGTGNTVANYIPLDNYLTMVDEGRLYA